MALVVVLDGMWTKGSDLGTGFFGATGQCSVEQFYANDALATTPLDVCMSDPGHVLGISDRVALLCGFAVQSGLLAKRRDACLGVCDDLDNGW